MLSGGYLSDWYQVPSKGYPNPGWICPCGQDRMGTHSQDRVGTPARTGWGTPSQERMGYPLARTGVSQDRRGYPLGQVRMGNNHPPTSQPGLGYPGQNSRASTCYAAGGTPLVFAQEDCLVLCRLSSLQHCSSVYCFE